MKSQSPVLKSLCRLKRCLKFSLYMLWSHIGEMKHSSIHSSPPYWIEVSGQNHAPAALLPRKISWHPLNKEAGWSPETVWTYWKGVKSRLRWDSSTRASSPIAKSQYCLCYPTFQRFVIVNVNLLIPLNIYALLLYKIHISSTMELWNISYIYRYYNGLTIIADRQCFRKGHTTNRPWLHHILMATNDSTGFVLSHKVPCSSMLTITLISENQLKLKKKLAAVNNPLKLW